MEREAFFTGYCRNIDESRMVALECEDTCLVSVDCDYQTCPHTQSCTIAQSMTAFIEQK